MLSSFARKRSASPTGTDFFSTIRRPENTASTWSGRNRECDGQFATGFFWRMSGNEFAVIGKLDEVVGLRSSMSSERTGLVVRAMISGSPSRMMPTSSCAGGHDGLLGAALLAGYGGCRALL
jgi:hypothetical protein